MQTEDIIELGSSDEEPGPPPPKKINVRNAMVHIPTNFHGVTIKPIKVNTAELPKLGKNITITKTSASTSSLTSKNKTPDKPLQKLVAAKKKALAKKPNPTNQTKGKVFNPLSQIKKGIVCQSVGNSTITKLKSPILIKKPPLTKPQTLQRLPPSITIKKTAALKLPSNTTLLPNTVAKPATKVGKKRKLEVVQTVELDDEEASTSTNNHQWYVRPEDQIDSSTQQTQATTQDDKTGTQDMVATTQEESNNKEPEGPKFIEITIEDSPIKPAKTKRTRELSTEKVITIDDSPNKGGVISDDVADGSDTEQNCVKKVPQSKKKLQYASDLKSIDETHTVEIEIEPMATNDIIIEVNNESRVISLTPEIMDVEQTSVEIAQIQQGAVTVLQTKPVQGKQNSKVAPKKEVLVESEFHPIYQSFIDLCIRLENSNDMEKIIEKKIKTYYRQVRKQYVESEEFLDMVSSKITAMEAAPEKMYLYIKDIVDELNLQRKFMKQVQVEENNTEDQDSFVCGKENELDPNKQRQIRKLEKTLKKLNRAIQKLENQEVDFDDEEDSVYLLTEKYKERMVRVHAKFCQLTNTKMPSQPKLIIDPRPGLSAAPAKRLEAWINKKDTVVFPDFHDVLRCVREANELDNLGWTEAFIMEEARDLFVRCGRKLQRRRQENEWRLATSRIIPNSDPAEHSDDLKKQLEANRRLASSKESEVFNKFSDKQNEMKLEAEEIDDKEADESPVESEEEDNDEVSSLESKQRRKDRLRRLLQEQSKKIILNKDSQIEEDINKELASVTEPVKSTPENKSDTVTEEIQSLSDDSNVIGSDMDELHLLQKLHSGSEIRNISSSDSDSETPIAISDTMESSSGDENETKQKPSDIISIENSSYSDESDNQKNNEIKSNKKFTVSSKELIEESKEIECTTSSVVKSTHTNEPPIENTILSSSDDDNTNSVKNENLSKVSLKRGVICDKDFELSVMSESAELCINADDFAKTSDAEDEQSINSDIIDNPGSSTSSGQYEELLKEHNADPLLKQPDLIPRDPSDKLFDSLMIKHYNDPLVKKHLKGSDSSNGDDPENSNSDTQSTNAPETIEEVKKDLIETSVDTEELLNSNSPSMQIVDKFVEKLKQSDGSQSSDDLLMSVDHELGLNPEAMSPLTLALEKEVNLARQTKAWPRFKDECSLSSSEGDNSQSMSAKIDETANDDSNERIDVTQGEVAAEEKNTSQCSPKSANEEMDVMLDNETAAQSNYTSASEGTKGVSEELDVGDIEMTSAEANVDASNTESPKAVNTKEIETDNKTKNIDTGSSAQGKRETESDELTANDDSPGNPDTNNTLMERIDFDEILCDDTPNDIPEENSVKNEDTLMEILNTNQETENIHDNSNELGGNGNLNINMDITDLLQCDAILSQKHDVDDIGLDDLNKNLSTDKDDCGGEEGVPRTFTMCLGSAEGND